MATRTILSPGVEIRERDLSLIAQDNVGTNVFVAGFANQGPADEVLKITTRDELDLIYGPPTNAAERYFYHTIRELLNSPAHIYTSRLPYGNAAGNGFDKNKYSALVYPARHVENGFSSYTFSFPTNSAATSLSAAQFSITISDGTTKTIGFSGTAFTPAASALNAYATLTGASPYSSQSLIAAVSAAVRTLDTSLALSAQFSSIAEVGAANDLLTYNLSATIPLDSTFSFANVPSNHSYDVKQAVSTNLNQTDGVYLLGAPTHVELSTDEYEDIIAGNAFQWSTTATSTFNSNPSSFAGAGLIILNKGQTAISDQFEGYYIGIGDNFDINPGTNFRSITGANTLSQAISVTTNTSYTPIPTSTLEFNLTARINGAVGSISQLMENMTDFQLDEQKDADLLNIGVFKLRKSIFSTEAFKLDYVLEDRIAGSIDSFRTISNERGGQPLNYFLETVDARSRNVEILVNDWISNKRTRTAMGIDGIPKKKVRVLTDSLIDVTADMDNLAVTGISPRTLLGQVSTLGLADNLYPLGTYTGANVTEKIIGRVDSKVERALEGVRNEDIYDIDLVVEAGLGTIFATTEALETDGEGSYYDDTRYDGTLVTQINGLRSVNNPTDDGIEIRNNYMVIFNIMNNFCTLPSVGGGRGDCMFIADPLRHILVTSRNNKVASNKSTIYQRDIYWALRHLYNTANSSWAATYANWAKGFDSVTGNQVWLPFSGFAAAAMSRNDANRFPWIAPAGFNNGLLPNVLELATTPNQKQRDELYKTNINPVTFFPQAGYVIYGQKTLSRKPSAFDRINVRRLFLALERPARKLAMYFVFEPNTTFTRTQLVSILEPIFERALNNEGVYDYLIVCDERNNTPQVIDNNELVVDFYIKPVRSAEFILLNFIATRTGANFSEIIGG